jgi:hypothetical protein
VRRAPRRDERLRPDLYLLGAVASTLFGIYVGDRIKRGLGTFVGGLAATLLWGFLLQAYTDARDRIAARRVLRFPTADVVLLTGITGLAFLLLGAAPFLAGRIGAHTADITVPLTRPWIIYAIAFGASQRDDPNLRPGSYRGPFSFLGEIVLAIVTAIWILFVSIGVGFAACGLAAAIAAGVSWLDYPGYASAVCGAMLAMRLWLPGKATTGFDEALGALVAILLVFAPVGWVAYFVATG